MACGTVPANNDGAIYSCFLYADRDTTCDEIADSIVVARGAIHSGKSPESSIVIENAAHSRAVKLFTARLFGLRLAKDLRVEHVSGGSRAEKSGLQVGDIIQFKDNTNNLLSALERSMRASYAIGADFELTVCRDGRLRELILSFTN
jgi:S1-C subfamily serine protease